MKIDTLLLVYLDKLRLRIRNTFCLSFYDTEYCAVHQALFFCSY